MPWLLDSSSFVPLCYPALSLSLCLFIYQRVNTLYFFVNTHSRTHRDVLRMENGGLASYSSNYLWTQIQYVVRRIPTFHCEYTEMWGELELRCKRTRKLLPPSFVSLNPVQIQSIIFVPKVPTGLNLKYIQVHS
jgi:hypothetical protein